MAAEVAIAGAIAVVSKGVPFLYKLCSNCDRRNIEEVRTWFDTTKAYLKDTEGREETEGWKNRVQQVRDLAYETEDAIEDLKYKVHEHVHHHRLTIFLHDAGHIFKDFVPLKRFSYQMKAIKEKVFRIRDFDTIRICPSQASSSSITEEMMRSQAYSFSRDDRLVLVGIDKRKDALFSIIFREESREVVISVVGDAGSGKTTLIREVYERLKENFQCYAFVTVPRSCEGLLEKLYEALELPFDPRKHISSSLRSHLQQKSYLLVFDGIWTEKEWICIKTLLPLNNMASRIIISTRKRNLAFYCASSHDCIYDLNLNPLTWDEACELFCDKAFQGGKCPDILVDWSMKIVKRCEGLPLAIVAVGDFLSNKPHTEKEFKNVHDSLEYEPANPVCHSYIGKFLQSYYHLAPNLKSCFLYFCNFPEDCSVTRGRLIRLWVAEGFIEEKRYKTLEDVAYEYLDELVQMNLVVASRWDLEGQVRSCRVSNLVRGFILSKSEKESFFTVLNSPRTSLGGKKIRRLSFHNCFCSELQKKDLNYVRTLSVFGESFESKEVKGLFSNYRLMRVLDLENAALPHFPEEVLNLTLLRYLSMRNSKIKSVPNSIKKLRNLMILDLRQTLVTILPENILELHELLYLLVDRGSINESAVGAEVDPGIGCLTSLQKLSLIKANYNVKGKKQSIVKELGKLIELWKLGITELKAEDGKDLCGSIEKMDHLSSLYVNSASNEEYLDLNYVTKSPELINRLFLGGRLKEIPAWICKLNSLFKIKLKWSKLQNSPLEALKTLLSLKELHLYDAYAGEMLEFSAEWFLELRTLEIAHCSQLNTIVIPEQAMRKLQKLTITNCDNLTMVHITRNQLSQLEEVLIVPPDLVHFLD